MCTTPNKNKNNDINNSYEAGLHDDNKALLLPRSILLSHPAPLHKENVARKMRQSIGKGKQDLDSFSQKCCFFPAQMDMELARIQYKRLHNIDPSSITNPLSRGLLAKHTLHKPCFCVEGKYGSKMNFQYNLLFHFIKPSYALTNILTP